MKLRIPLFLATVLSLCLGGLLGYLNSSPPPPWADVRGWLAYPTGTILSLYVMLAAIYATLIFLYGVIFLFRNRRR
jgi:hypothetical protein